MEFKFDNSEKLLFEYIDELFDQYLHREQRDQVESFLMRLRYEEEKDLLHEKIVTYPEYVQQLWFGAYLGKIFKEKGRMFRIGVRQCPFLLYLLHLASYDVFEQEGLEKPYLCRQTEIGIYHFMTEENWYDLVKNEADLDGFFAGTGFQYLWIGDEKERKPCGLTILPIEEDLRKYSFWEMDRLPDGTICFKDEFIPEFVRKSRQAKRYWVSINICRLSIEEELLLRKHKPQTEKEMKDVIAMAWKGSSKWQILERFYQLEHLKLLPCVI